MGEEIEFETGPKWSNFSLSWAPNLDLDVGSGHGHYLFHLSSSTTCIPNFIEIEETFCGRTDTRTYGQKFAMVDFQSLEVDLKNEAILLEYTCILLGSLQNLQCRTDHTTRAV